MAYQQTRNLMVSFCILYNCIYSNGSLFIVFVFFEVNNSMIQILLLRDYYKWAVDRCFYGENIHKTTIRVMFDNNCL